MQGDNQFDTQSDKGYNTNQSVWQDANNDVHEVIRMAGKPPLNDPNCEHEFVEDPSDTIGDSVAWVCRKRDCGIGHFRKRENKNPS